MSRVYVKAERVVNARPEDVYAVLIDYKNKRPQMLPPNFLEYTVEKGGHGSSTIVCYILRAANRQRQYKMRIDEPVKGKVITERDANSSLVTTWSLLPLSGGRQTRVRVTSEWKGSSGIGGFFEKTFAPLGLRRIYGSMLDMLSGLLKNNAYVSDERVTAVRGREYPLATNATAFLAIFLAVIGLAYGIGRLIKRQ